MGKADIESKKYMSDAARFADVVNYYVFDGRQIVHPNALTPLDTTEIVTPYGNGAISPVQKYRDTAKLWSAMVDNRAVYIILGAENQTDVHGEEGATVRTDSVTTCEMATFIRTPRSPFLVRVGRRRSSRSWEAQG